MATFNINLPLSFVNGTATNDTFNLTPTSAQYSWWG